MSVSVDGAVQVRSSTKVVSFAVGCLIAISLMAGMSTAQQASRLQGSPCGRLAATIWGSANTSPW
eukprot:12573326-Heterocapsa_arctica.AAC.1